MQNMTARILHWNPSIVATIVEQLLARVAIYEGFSEAAAAISIWGGEKFSHIT